MFYELHNDAMSIVATSQLSGSILSRGIVDLNMLSLSLWVFYNITKLLGNVSHDLIYR